MVKLIRIFHRTVDAIGERCIVLWVGLVCVCAGCNSITFAFDDRVLSS